MDSSSSSVVASTKVSKSSLIVLTEKNTIIIRGYIMMLVSLKTDELFRKVPPDWIRKKATIQRRRRRSSSITSNSVNKINIAFDYIYNHIYKKKFLYDRVWTNLKPEHKRYIASSASAAAAASRTNNNNQMDEAICLEIYNNIILKTKMAYGEDSWCFLDVILQQASAASAGTKTKCNCLCRTMLYVSVCENLGLLGNPVQMNITYGHTYVSLKNGSNKVLQLTSQTQIDKMPSSDRSLVDGYIEYRTSDPYHILANQLTQIVSSNSSSSSSIVAKKTVYSNFIRYTLSSASVPPDTKRAIEMMISLFVVHLFDPPDYQGAPPILKKMSRDPCLQMEVMQMIRNRTPISLYMNVRPHEMIEKLVGVVRERRKYDKYPELFSKREGNIVHVSVPLDSKSCFSARICRKFLYQNMISGAMPLLRIVRDASVNNSFMLGIYNIDERIDERNRFRHYVTLACIASLRLLLEIIFGGSSSIGSSKSYVIITKIFGGTSRFKSVGHFILKCLCICVHLVSSYDMFDKLNDPEYPHKLDKTTLKPGFQFTKSTVARFQTSKHTFDRNKKDIHLRSTNTNENQYIKEEYDFMERLMDDMILRYNAASYKNNDDNNKDSEQKQRIYFKCVETHVSRIKRSSLRNKIAQVLSAAS